MAPTVARQPRHMRGGAAERAGASTDLWARTRQRAAMLTATLVPRRPHAPSLGVRQGGADRATTAAAADDAELREVSIRAPPVPIDRVLLMAVAGLLLIGLLMVFSASQFDVAGDPSYWFRRQLTWGTLGVVALVFTARVDYHFWRRVALWGMLAALALLVIVLKVGHTAYGAQRWLHLGLFSFQPSEVAKLALAVYVADWLARKGDEVATFAYGLVPFALVTGVVLGLVLMQNDLGTAVIIACLALTMFFTAGANVLQLVPTLALGAATFAVITVRTGFRRARVDAFLHPLPPDCTGAYQLCQGLISLGSGGLFGRGLGASVQKAGYLPNPFTDSIFAVLGEELGLVGCALVLGLFAALAYRGFRAGRRAPDVYGALLACGITCWLLVQALVNVGSVVDAIPFTGVPLPFVSFGGSSLVMSLAAVGILLNISRASRRDGGARGGPWGMPRR
ncbi:MAG: putative lipid II flippase FtsW [Ktedonobacterales bacterium]